MGLLRKLGTRAPSLLKEREMWGIRYPPLVDMLIDMAWYCVHQNMTKHFSGVRFYPRTKLNTCMGILSNIQKLLCGKDYEALSISMAFTPVDLSREQPVPKTFIVNRDCQVNQPCHTFNENGHTAVQAVSFYFKFSSLLLLTVLP